MRATAILGGPLARHPSLALRLLILLLPAAGPPPGLAAEKPDDGAFLVRNYTNSSGKVLPYRLLRPEPYDPKVRYPVILYLHGAAARGRDNAEPLNWGPRLIRQSLEQRHPAFLIVPQAPRESGWLESAWGGALGSKESPSLALALELVEQALPEEFSIDPHRRYLTGVSMGGHAVWAMMVRRPGFFAAAVPVCAGGSARMVTKAAAKYPVWAFHSDDDHLVPVRQARTLVQAWRSHGGIARYTEYTGVRHSSWKNAYVDPALYDWLFAQHLEKNTP